MDCVALLSLMRRDVTVGSCGNDTMKPSASARNSRHWSCAVAGAICRANATTANAKRRMSTPQLIRSVPDIDQRAAIHRQLYSGDEVRLVGGEEQRGIGDVPGGA